MPGYNLKLATIVCLHIFSVSIFTVMLPFVLREVHRLKVFENRVLRRIFGLKSYEIIGHWRKLHNEELHNLYSPPDIIRMIKSRRMRWAGHVARMREKRNAYRILVESQKDRDHHEYLDVGRRVLLKRIVEKYDGVVWTGLIWLMIGYSGVLL
jgi:hypothetical protein